MDIVCKGTHTHTVQSPVMKSSCTVAAILKDKGVVFTRGTKPAINLTWCWVHHSILTSLHHK